MNIDKLIRSNIKKFETYIPSKTIDQVSCEVRIPAEKIMKVDSGENPYVEILQNKKMMEKINLYLYPDPDCKILRQKLSSYTGYDPKWILCGNGSDELIELLIKLFVSASDEIIISPPTFSMYAFYGKLYNAKIISVLRDKELNIDEEKILDSISEKTKIIFIDSPGNPSSVVTRLENINKLLEKEIIVVVDEAYFEYCNYSVIQYVKNYPNLIVLRTLSKWAGLAGLRIGYMVANPRIIDLLNAIKPPYNVNSFAQATGIWMLEKKDRYLKVINEIVALRREIIDQLFRFPELKVYPSQGAYIVIKPKKNTLGLFEFLKKNGILVKVLNQPKLRNCLRINLLNKENMIRFISVIRSFYEN